MRLLVVEDNVLNQEVIEQVLIQAGACVVLAANGVAAVYALGLEGARFDAVLMDIQMPVMDGYTATRVIREELGLIDLPIIAVTAHARPLDRERTRQAGMAGHLVKPLNVKDLLAVVGQVCVQNNKGFYTHEDSVPLAALPLAAVSGIDRPGIVTFFGGNEAICLQMLNKFWAQQSGDVAKVRQLLGAQRVHEAINVLHSLCGIAGLLLAKPLARAAFVAEEALRAGQTQGLAHLLEDIERALQAVHVDILDFEQHLGAVN
jgi:CheY-like chemotaxis protein